MLDAGNVTRSPSLSKSKNDLPEFLRSLLLRMDARIKPITLLLDLDDTLLDSNMDTLIQDYFQALSRYLADVVDPGVMLTALMAGTRKMIANDHPGQTLQQVFDAEFFPAIGAPRQQLQARIDRFYQEVFPTLKDLTTPRPEAISLVEWLLAQGYRVAIATNPLFPQAAIYQRMDWAGLPADKYRFEVVSSYETFHFTKPNPAFFAEVLARMGWPEGPVLMVGDDPVNDIAGSADFGLASYWIDGHKQAGDARESVIGHGSLTNLRAWLEANELSRLTPSFTSHASRLTVLRASPAALGGMLAGIDGAFFLQRPFPDEWSLTEVVCHLRDTELEIHLPQIQTILTQEDPFLPAADNDAWAIERKYNKQDIAEALAGFISARLESLDLLKGLAEEQWLRKARHAIFGPSTLHDIVQFMVQHDVLHVRQFKETAGQSLT